MVSYLTMVAAGLIVGAVLRRARSGAGDRAVAALTSAITWDATTYLNIATLVVIALLLMRFLRTGGVSMLRMMNMPVEQAVHAA